jgi:hypothetical protein
MAMLCEVFDRQPTQFLLSAYYSVLQDLSGEDFDVSVHSVLESHRFAKMPLPAEIKDQIRGASQDAAIVALDKLERAMARQGAYRSVMFDDRLIHAVVSSLGGWPKLCQMEMEEWKWVRKDFERLYKAFSSQPEGRLVIPDHLPGIAEISNEANGYGVREDVVEIGYINKGFCVVRPKAASHG